MEYYKNLDLADVVYFCELNLIQKTEQWRDIVDFIGRYQISDLGRLKSLGRFRDNGNGGYVMKSRMMKQNADRDGYLLTGLRKPGVQISGKIHRLVAQAFIPNPLNLSEVNHIGLYPNGKEGNKEDNRVVSLKWSTGKENMEHASANGLLARGETHKHSKLTENEVLEIRKSILSHKELSVIYNTSRPNITRIINKQRWKHI